jgi:hypothetical protein
VSDRFDSMTKKLQFALLRKSKNMWLYQGQRGITRSTRKCRTIVTVKAVWRKRLQLVDSGIGYYPAILVGRTKLIKIGASEKENRGLSRARVTPNEVTAKEVNLTGGVYYISDDNTYRT